MTKVHTTKEINLPKCTNFDAPNASNAVGVAVPLLAFGALKFGISAMVPYAMLAKVCNASKSNNQSRRKYLFKV